MNIRELWQSSLRFKALLSASIAVTLLIGITAWFVQREVTRNTTESLVQEARGSLQAYESLWKARANLLGSVSLLISTMSDVRAAFRTGDEATIEDMAGDLWARLSPEDAFFLVVEPGGRIIASLGGAPSVRLSTAAPVLAAASNRFPDQAFGFLRQANRLYQVVVTPVYLHSGGSGAALFNVLIAGFHVDEQVANQMKRGTGGSEFVFVSEGNVVGSTLPHHLTTRLVRSLPTASDHISDGETEYVPLRQPLLDFNGQQVGELLVLRSFEAAQKRISELRQNLFVLWVVTLSVALVLIYVLTRRLIQPLQQLDRAAAEVTRRNYHSRVEVSGKDELARLAQTFNDMCVSIEGAREELIRQERLSTISRLSSSIVHDLRNPLAAVYGGAEMLVDGHLTEPQTRRLAANIYRASKRIQELLQQLSEAGQKKDDWETCPVNEIVSAACEAMAASAEAQAVRIDRDLPADAEVRIQRGRMERVFVNLLENAIEAMPSGGTVAIRGARNGNFVKIEVADTGAGIPDEIRDRLFQPFVTMGKKNGLGLGLALSRQAVLEQGGDLIALRSSGSGAVFQVQLPLLAPTPGQ